MHTSDEKHIVRALGLCSGGLDSILAALVLKNQGIDVTWICFETPFFSADEARKAAKMTGITLIVQDITFPHFHLLHAPKAGFGKNMNPCIDCHALMFATAFERMQKDGYDFLFSGEVMGQRPKSQTKNSMRQVEKLAGCQGKILRPLSALNLPVTEMETSGLVDRDRLLGISGRSRKVQMEMAKELGITEYPSPAGGCLLTDAGFSRRLKNLIQDYSMKDPVPRHIHLLKHGRHFRLSEPMPGDRIFDANADSADTPAANFTGCKLILGRSRGDNQRIMKLYDKKEDVWIRHNSLPGPDGIVTGNHDEEKLEIAARILSAYTKAPAGELAPVRIVENGETRVIEVIPFSTEETSGMFI